MLLAIYYLNLMNLFKSLIFFFLSEGNSKQGKFNENFVGVPRYI